MSYGMHDYLADKAMQRQSIMRKYAAEGEPKDFPVEYYISTGAIPTNPKTLEEYNRVMGMRNMREEIDRRDKEEGPGEQPTWSSYYTGKLKNMLSRSRAFIAEHPEILYGLGGAGIGAGIGALVSPKRRLLGSLVGFGLGGLLGAGGKMAWDKWGDDIKSTLGKPIYRRTGTGRTPNEEKNLAAIQEELYNNNGKIAKNDPAYNLKMAVKNGEYLNRDGSVPQEQVRRGLQALMAETE